MIFASFSLSGPSCNVRTTTLDLTGLCEGHRPGTPWAQQRLDVVISWLPTCVLLPAVWNAPAPWGACPDPPHPPCIWVLLGKEGLALNSHGGRGLGNPHCSLLFPGDQPASTQAFHVPGPPASTSSPPSSHSGGLSMVPRHASFSDCPFLSV